MSLGLGSAGGPNVNLTIGSVIIEFLNPLVPTVLASPSETHSPSGSSLSSIHAFCLPLINLDFFEVLVPSPSATHSPSASASGQCLRPPSAPRLRKKHVHGSSRSLVFITLSLIKPFFLLTFTRLFRLGRTFTFLLVLVQVTVAQKSVPMFACFH